MFLGLRGVFRPFSDRILGSSKTGPLDAIITSKLRQPAPPSTREKQPTSANENNDEDLDKRESSIVTGAVLPLFQVIDTAKSPNFTKNSNPKLFFVERYGEVIGARIAKKVANKERAARRLLASQSINNNYNDDGNNNGPVKKPLFHSLDGVAPVVLDKRLKKRLKNELMWRPIKRLSREKVELVRTFKGLREAEEVAKDFQVSKEAIVRIWRTDGRWQKRPTGPILPESRK
jgi:hypothetical protein